MHGEVRPSPKRDPQPPTVSVVVPTYRRPAMLSRLLESIGALAYPAGRIDVVVVGGFNDAGRPVVEQFAQFAAFPIVYKIVPEETNGAVAVKRNVGARSTHGEIIAFIDDDCIADPDWLASAVPFFADPCVGGVEGLIDVPRPERPTPIYRASLRLSTPKGYRTANIFYRRTVFEQVGGFDESLPYMEDTDLGVAVIGRGYRIPFASGSKVSHPVQPPRPLWLLTMARTVDQVPYLYRKHRRCLSEIRGSVRLFNRSHYLYLALYAAVLVISIWSPLRAALMLGIGVCSLVVLQLSRKWWGLRVTVREVLLTGLCLPVVPLVRLIYWLKGSVTLWLGIRGSDRIATR